MSSSGTARKGALIGCGYVSRFHLEGWARVPQAQLVALCDLAPDRLEHAAARFPEARRYTDASRLFAAEPGLDFVEICTRPEAHLGLVELAAAHGVHILCQKPAALVRADLEAMIAAAGAAEVRLMFHENWRFRAWYRALRSEILAGTIGRPIRIRINHRDTRALRSEGYDDQPYFRTMPRLILLEMGCHLIDTARFLIGEEVASVSASLGKFGPSTLGEDVATLSLHFVGGCMGLLDITWCAPAELARAEWALNDTVVEGTAGAIRLLTDGSLEKIDLNGRRERISVPLPADDEVYVEGYAATQRHFLSGLIDGRSHETSAADTLRTMDVVWAGYRSAEEGRPQACHPPGPSLR